MTILLAWFLAIMLLLGAGYLGYKVIHSLPALMVKFIKAREEMRRERLLTEKLEQEVINEQLKALDEV